jgi:cell division initiation protein
MITPVDIRNQQFGRSLRGFDPDDVKAFLHSLSNEWETVLVENKTLKIELEKTKETLNGYKEMESMLHRTLMQAEQSSRLVHENAQREAELKIMEAEQQANQLIQSASLESELKLQEAEQRSLHIINRSYDERSRIEMEINQLLHRRNEILNQLHLYLNSQLERIKAFQKEETVQLTITPTEEIRTAFEAEKEALKGAASKAQDAPQPDLQTNIATESQAQSVTVKLEPVDFSTEPITKPKTESKAPAFAFSESQSFFDKLVRTPERMGLISAISDEL